MDERRRETRRRLTTFTPVYDLQPRTLLGYLGDLTLRGALVIGINAATLNKKTRIEINFPSDLSELETFQVRVPVRIAWCRQDESPDYFNIGVQFLELEPKQVELFHQILARYQFRYTLSDSDFDE